MPPLPSRASRRPLRALLATTAATVALLGAGAVAVPAHAGQQSAHDQARDVRRLAMEGQRGTPVRRDSARDLLSADARFARGKLVVSVRFRDLRASGYLLYTDVKTSAGRYRIGYDRETTSPSVSVLTVRGTRTSCTTVPVRAKLRKDRVRVVVPRSCIGGGSARWVKFGALVLHERSNGQFLVDDLRRRDRVDVSYGGIKLGPRLRYN